MRGPIRSIATERDRHGPGALKQMPTPTNTTDLERLDPSLAIRQGTWDAYTVLVLWCMRRAFLPMLWIGLSVAVIALGEPEAMSEATATLEKPEELLSGLRSPLGLVVVAIGVRVTTNLLSLVAVLPLTRSHSPADQSSRWRLIRMIRAWRDRIRYARAYRALRWTWEARDLAYLRLAAAGRPLARCESVFRWTNVGGFVFLILLTAFVAQ